jgi:TatD DNase family protein
VIDSHIHLDQYKNIAQHIDSWKLSGISKVIAVSTDLKSSYQTLELQEKFPNFVHAAVGFHPERPLPAESDFLEWQALVKSERDLITAIGEVGLPHYSLAELPNSLDQYVEFLSRCLEVATLSSLPTVLHAVHDKAIIVYDLLQHHQIKAAHFHWLKAPPQVLNLIIKGGYYISVTPEVCYRSRDQELARTIPLSQLLMETDGPWRFENQFSNQQTSPLLLHEVADTLGSIKGQSSDFIKQETVKNTVSCFNLL